MCGKNDLKIKHYDYNAKQLKIKPKMLDHISDRYVCGVDEVGRGCLFGPVVAAAVVLPRELEDGDMKQWEMVKDSKRVTEKRRVQLAEFIKTKAVSYDIQEVSHEIIDQVNILEASMIAMEETINNVYTDMLESKQITLDEIFVDGNRFRKCYMPPGDDDIMIPHTCFEQGDNKYLCIAAASIIAKVYRDDLIVQGCDDNPEWNNYDLKKNKGYGTRKHMDALKEHGAIFGHRRTFNGVL